MNYGETLVYWYLRFNGFFPLRNFVLHSSRREEQPTQEESYIQGADCDLIAVRFPHVYEEVGGQPGDKAGESDWDSRFNTWGFSLKAEVIGLIVEVKTGNLDHSRELSNALTSFRRERIKADIQRMGIFDKQDVENNWIENLSKHAVFPVPGENTSYRIGKLLVSRQNIKSDQVLTITLKDIDDFIEKRIQKYKDRKNRDRILFPDDLLQYMLWKQDV